MKYKAWSKTGLRQVWILSRLVQFSRFSMKISQCYISKQHQGGEITIHTKEFENNRKLYELIDEKSGRVLKHILQRLLIILVPVFDFGTVK